MNYTQLTDTITLSEMPNGFWLYDKTRGMNLSMRAKTSTAAFVEALTYYQNRLRTVEQDYDALQLKVDAFVKQFADRDDEGAS